MASGFNVIDKRLSRHLERSVVMIWIFRENCCGRRMLLLYCSDSQTVCRGRFACVLRVLSKCFLLLQIFCQNRENDAITGHGERINDLFFGNLHHIGLYHVIIGGRGPEKW